jgi:hypothetical protein
MQHFRVCLLHKGIQHGNGGSRCVFVAGMTFVVAFFNKFRSKAPAKLAISSSRSAEALLIQSNKQYKTMCKNVMPSAPPCVHSVFYLHYPNIPDSLIKTASQKYKTSRNAVLESECRCL